MLNEDCLHLYDTAEFAKFLIQKGHNKLWPPQVTLGGGGGAYEDNMIKLKKSSLKYLIAQYYVTEETCLCIMCILFKCLTCYHHIHVCVCLQLAVQAGMTFQNMTCMDGCVYVHML